MQKLIRGIMILIFGIAIVCFGVYIRPHSDSAEAKVFDKLFSYTRAMPEYLLEGRSDAAPRRIKVNGNQTYLTVRSSEDEITDILDFYAGQYKPLPFYRDAVEQFSRIDNPSITERLTRVYDALDCFKADQQFRFQGENYGFWGAFEFYDQDMTIGSPEFNQQVAAALESGQLGRLGTFRVAMALKQGDGSGSKILNIWTDETFDLDNLYPDSFGDMPGKDIENVSRYPGAVRQLSIEQENIQTTDSVVVYESEGSVPHHILFYHSFMKNAGWRIDDAFEEAMKARKRDNVMFYKRGGRECTITVAQDSPSGKIITTVTERNYKNV